MSNSSLSTLISTLATNVSEQPVLIPNQPFQQRFDLEYSDKEKIGLGGFASVYKAKNHLDGHYYAIKKVKLALKSIKKNFDREIIRILDEAKVLAKVNHKNILRYYNSWLEGVSKMKHSEQQKQQQQQHDEEEEHLPTPTRKLHKGYAYKHYGGSRDSSVSIEGSEEADNSSANEEDDYDFDYIEENNNNNNNAEDDDDFLQFDRSEGPQKAKFNTTRFQIGDLSNTNPKSSFLEKRASQILTTPKPTKKCKTQIDDDFLEFESPTEVQTSKTEKKSLPKPEEILKSITFYIQTELCSETLEDYLNHRNQQLDEIKSKPKQFQEKIKRGYFKEGLSFAKQIIEGLSHIHSHGIVHRDLKPGNIFLQEKVIKIGDFGLVKKLRAFHPMQASPVQSQVTPTKEQLRKLEDNFKLDQTPVKESELFDRYLDISLLRTTSSPEKLDPEAFIKQNAAQTNPLDLGTYNEDDLFDDIDSPMTKSVGTRTFASPEQLRADKNQFDHRADIFSLGLVFLLIFHPMTTAMERFNTMKDAKKGILPKSLLDDYPELAQTIIMMMSNEPSKRPTLKEIMRVLNKPLDLYAQLAGALTVKRENSMTWRDKFFKLIDQNLYIFNKEEDKKAENVYDLSQWKMKLEGRISSIIDLDEETASNLTTSLNKSLNDIENQVPQQSQPSSTELRPSKLSTSSQSSQKSRDVYNPLIIMENSMQLGCAFKTQDFTHTSQLYKKFVSSTDVI